MQLSSVWSTPHTTLRTTIHDRLLQSRLCGRCRHRPCIVACWKCELFICEPCASRCPHCMGTYCHYAGCFLDHACGESADDEVAEPLGGKDKGKGKGNGALGLVDKGERKDHIIVIVPHEDDDDGDIM